ncbi:MAG: hypothetical protein JWP53_3581 [Conexibacter sp.]|jgi:hypothetical protein|nr:hypothetical protein [Conexibacter sp.]MDX6733348.1 Abnormal spindle-like microcephaly-assocd, ASPM-SPD-2-Hydin [Baekduia sp.]
MFPPPSPVKIVTGTAADTAKTAALTARTVAFGGAHPVGTVTTRQLVLRNTGLGPFAFTGSPTVSGDAEQDFIVGTPNCNGFVASCRIAVLFAPSATGQRTATLTVPTSDDAGPLEVPLSGTATAAAEPAPLKKANGSTQRTAIVIS